jgi:hypothetical protein
MGYRLYHRKGDCFFHIDEIDAASDADAMRQAEPLRGGAASELWHGQRRVSAYAPLAKAAAARACWAK